MNKATQDFLGCTPPNADSIALPGFAEEQDYVITWFPTRMNATAPPADTVGSTSLGLVTLDLSDTPYAYGGIANNYLDTLHTDYAFIIAPELIVRSMIAQEEDDTVRVMTDWDFTLYPNPADEAVTVALPIDNVPREVTLFDMAGRRMFSRLNVTARVLGITTAGLGKGAYCVRVSDCDSHRTRILVIQ